MAISADTYIPTLTTWKRADQITTDDYVYGPDGLPKKVKLVQPYTPLEMFQVELDDFITLEGDKHLSFPVESKCYRKNLYRRKGKRKDAKDAPPMSVDSLLLKDLKNHRNASLWSIPNSKPVQYRWEDLPVDPFVVGYWYMSRSVKSKLYAPKGKKQEILINKVKDLGYKTKVRRYDYVHLDPSVPRALELHYGQIPKYIPDDYFFSSTDQRIELLKGIVFGRRASVNMQQTGYEIAQRDLYSLRRIQGLCESLGIQTRIRKAGKVIYKLSFYTNIDLMVPVKNKSKYGFQRRYIKALKQIEPKPCVHIVTDGLFLAQEGYVPVC